MADSEETNLDIETVPVGSGSGAEFSAEPFNLDYALAGGILFAKDNSTQNTYYVASEFDNKSGDTWYRYRAKIRNKFYNFNNKGEMAQGKYTLYCGEGTIDTAGAEQGDMHKRTEGSTDVYYFLNSLNYRETVASSVLNAMIGHIADPLSYSESTIKLLVKKSFQFAVEFMNQAIALRKNNDVEINDSEEPVPAETPTEMLLHTIATKLDSLTDIKNAFIEEGSGSGSGVPAEPTTILSKISEMSERIETMKNAMYDDSALIPTSLLTELSSIKDSQEGIADALIGQGSGSSSGIMGMISAINLGVQNVESSLGSKGSGQDAITILQGIVNELGSSNTGTFGSNLDTIISRLGASTSSTFGSTVMQKLEHLVNEVGSNLLGSVYNEVCTTNNGTLKDLVWYIYNEVGNSWIYDIYQWTQDH